MIRLGMIAALAAAAAGAKGPDPSSFAGTYLWGTGQVPVTISEDGRITSSTLDVSGRVRAEGSYSFTVTEIIYVEDETPPYSHKPRFLTVRTKFAGTMAFDASGNIVGTASDGASFVWIRQ
jgi:hypothetical protein